MKDNLETIAEILNEVILVKGNEIQNILKEEEDAKK